MKTLEAEHLVSIQEIESRPDDFIDYVKRELARKFVNEMDMKDLESLFNIKMHDPRKAKAPTNNEEFEYHKFLGTLMNRRVVKFEAEVHIK